MAARESEWQGKHYACYTNKACEFYPCHSLPEGKALNCLFCYCPLYALGRDCGGQVQYTADGVKDCSGCTLPHLPERYGYIMARLGRMIGDMARREREQER